VSHFQRIALLQTHQRLAPVHAYYLNDLVELCGLASAVRDRVSDVDLPVSPSDREPLATFERYLRRHRPQLVGLSVFTCGANSAREYARLAHQHGAFVLVGGFHPSARPEEVLGWDGVDAVVRGEGEQALTALIERGAPDDIPGMSYRSNGGFTHQPVPPVIEDLDSLPLPARELRPERFGLTGLDYHTDTVFASRGCRGRCRFCANHLVGRTWRARSNASIMHELVTLTPPRKGPWKYVKFWDSNFLADPQRIEALCGLILEEGLERWFRFIVETRVEDIIRAAPILPTMRRAGFVRVGCGVESPNRTTHRELGKGINLDHVGRAAELLADANMQFTKFLIIGHAHETRDDILRYPDYALSHGVRLQKTTTFVMTPYPGTEIAADYAAEGQVTSFDWDLYTNFGAVVAPNGISSLELQGLLFTVAADVGMGARLLDGRSFRSMLERLVEPLVIAVKMSLLNGRFTRDEVVAELMRALARLAERRRPVRARRRRSPPRAIRFHADGHPAVVVGLLPDGDDQVLTVRQQPEPLNANGRPVKELHVSLDRVVRLVERTDHRLLSHDATTLRWKPTAFRPRWAPGLAREVVRVLAAVAGMAAFHTRRSLARPSPRMSS